MALLKMGTSAKFRKGLPFLKLSFFLSGDMHGASGWSCNHTHKQALVKCAHGVVKLSHLKAVVQAGGGGNDIAPHPGPAVHGKSGTRKPMADRH